MSSLSEFAYNAIKSGSIKQFYEYQSQRPLLHIDVLYLAINNDDLTALQFIFNTILVTKETIVVLKEYAENNEKTKCFDWLKTYIEN